MWWLCALVACAQVEQVHIALGDDPCTQTRLSWASDSKSMNRVEYFPQGHPTSRLSEISQVHHYNWKEYQSPYLHHVLLKDLLPGTKYCYSIGSEKTMGSSEFCFKTLERDSRSIVLGLIGDLGQTLNSIKTVKALEQDPEGIDVVLFAGDLSYADKKQALWDSWSRLFEYSQAKTPWMYAPGNHEVFGPQKHRFIAYRHRFQMPSNSEADSDDFKNQFWSLDIGPAHVIALSTEISYGKDSIQYKWFLNHLQRIDRKKTPWLFVMFHRPFYSSNLAHRGEASAFRDIYEEIFQMYCVDLVINGHVHAYERSFPVFQNVTRSDSPVYLTVGNGGNKEGVSREWDKTPSWSAFHKSAYGYTRLQIFNDTHAKLFAFGNEHREYHPLEAIPLETHIPMDEYELIRYRRGCLSLD